MNRKDPLFFPSEVVVLQMRRLFVSNVDACGILLHITIDNKWNITFCLWWSGWLHLIIQLNV
jgi:hypothetical protein